MINLHNVTTFGKTTVVCIFFFFSSLFLSIVVLLFWNVNVPFWKLNNYFDDLKNWNQCLIPLWPTVLSISWVCVSRLMSHIHEKMRFLKIEYPPSIPMNCTKRNTCSLDYMNENDTFWTLFISVLRPYDDITLSVSSYHSDTLRYSLKKWAGNYELEPIYQ